MMDVLGVYLPGPLLWAIAAAGLIYLYSTWPFSTFKAIGIPGPKPTPFIGNIRELMEQEHFGAYDAICKKKYGNVFGLYEGRWPVIVMHDPDLLKEVCVKQFQYFTDRRPFPLRDFLVHSIMDVRGTEWKRIRNLLTPFFSSGKLKNNMCHIQDCANNMVAHLEKYAEKGEAFEAKEICGGYSLDVICATAFGLKVDSQQDPDNPFIAMAKKVVEVKPSNFLLIIVGLFPFLGPLLDLFHVTPFPAGQLEFFAKVTREVMKERKESKEVTHDFIQSMVKAHQEELDLEQKEDLGGVSEEEMIRARRKGLTEDEILAQAVVFFLAGYDTTSTALSFFLFLLASHPDCQDRLAKEVLQVMGQEGNLTYDKMKEMTYMNMCLDESLRLYPPVFRVDRRTVSDVTVNGVYFPKGMAAVIPIWALHHDPDYWPDVDKFDPERFSPEAKQSINPYTYCPFGLGPRNCIGIRMAQIEVKLAVAMILRKFRVVLDKKTQIPLKLEPKAFFPRALGGLWFTLEPRTPASQ